MIELTLAIFGIDRGSNGVKIKLGKLPNDRVQAFALMLSRRMGFALSNKQKQIVRMFFKEFRVRDKKQVFKILQPSSPQSTKQSSYVQGLALKPSPISSKQHDGSRSSLSRIRNIVVDDTDSCEDPETFEIYEGSVERKFVTETSILTIT